VRKKPASQLGASWGTRREPKKKKTEGSGPAKSMLTSKKVVIEVTVPARSTGGKEGDFFPNEFGIKKVLSLLREKMAKGRGDRKNWIRGECAGKGISRSEPSGTARLR